MRRYKILEKGSYEVAMERPLSVVHENWRYWLKNNGEFIANFMTSIIFRNGYYYRSIDDNILLIFEEPSYYN